MFVAGVCHGQEASRSQAWVQVPGPKGPSGPKTAVISDRPVWLDTGPFLVSFKNFETHGKRSFHLQVGWELIS